MRPVIFLLMLFCVPAICIATPPLVEKIERETGIHLTMSQREERASLSWKKHEALKEALDTKASNSVGPEYSPTLKVVFGG